MKTYLAVFLFLLLTSCATPSTVMINKHSKEWRTCSATGWGWVGAPLAIMSHDSCVESLKKVGYVPIDEVR